MSEQEETIEFLHIVIDDLKAKIARQEEELRIVAAQRQDKQAALTEARALLERLVPMVQDHTRADGSLLGTTYDSLDSFRALWLDARAFLQKMEASQTG